MSKIINPRQTTRPIGKTPNFTQYMANSVLEHYNPLAAPLQRTQHAQNAPASCACQSDETSEVCMAFPNASMLINTPYPAYISNDRNSGGNPTLLRYEDKCASPLPPGSK
jgi:hypothetical protein